MRLSANILVLVAAVVSLLLNPNLRHVYVDTTTDISPSFEKARSDIRHIEDVTLARSIAIDYINTAQGYYKDFVKYYKWTHILLVLVIMVAAINIGFELRRSNNRHQVDAATPRD